MQDTEYVKLLLRQADPAQHQTVATQRLNGVDPHAAHHLADFVVPCAHQVDKPLRPHIRVKPLHQVGPLGRNAPVALAGVAGPAQMAPERQQAAVAI